MSPPHFMHTHNFNCYRFSFFFFHSFIHFVPFIQADWIVLGKADGVGTDATRVYGQACIACLTATLWHSINLSFAATITTMCFFIHFLFGSVRPILCVRTRESSATQSNVQRRSRIRLIGVGCESKLDTKIGKACNSRSIPLIWRWPLKGDRTELRVNRPNESARIAFINIQWRSMSIDFRFDPNQDSIENKI